MNFLKKRKTISKEIFFEGIGVHSGKKSTVLLKPSEKNNGIYFIKNNKRINLDINNIKSDFLCTSISENGETIKTIEHLLSSLYALGITDLEIEVNSDEIPILDGSAFLFSEKINELSYEKKEQIETYDLKETIFISSNSKFIIAIPSNTLKINYFLDYDNIFPYFSHEKFVLDSNESYIEKISKARTFGFMKDADKILSLGMALGTNNDNTLLIEKNYYCSNLRYKNEIAKHKVLDFIGDLSFLKRPINAEFFCYKTGHKEHLEITKKLLLL